VRNDQTGFARVSSDFERARGSDGFLRPEQDIQGNGGVVRHWIIAAAAIVGKVDDDAVLPLGYALGVTGYLKG
jgi:hypothetical protein